jgi:hypothetical protein
LQHAFFLTPSYTDLTDTRNHNQKSREGIMVSHMNVALVAFVVLSAVLIGVLALSMHLRHRYSPNLIGALIGALLCFVLLEAIPTLT